MELMDTAALRPELGRVLMSPGPPQNTGNRDGAVCQTSEP